MGSAQVGMAGGGWGGCCAAASDGPETVYVPGTRVQAWPSSQAFFAPWFRGYCLGTFFGTFSVINRLV